MYLPSRNAVMTTWMLEAQLKELKERCKQSGDLVVCQHSISVRQDGFLDCELLLLAPL
jgi:hypothetical protein